MSQVKKEIKRRSLQMSQKWSPHCASNPKTSEHEAPGKESDWVSWGKSLWIKPTFISSWNVPRCWVMLASYVFFFFLAWFASLTIISEVKQQLLPVSSFNPAVEQTDKKQKPPASLRICKGEFDVRELSPFFGWLNVIWFNSIPKQEPNIWCVQTLTRHCWGGQTSRMLPAPRWGASWSKSHIYTDK